MYKLLLSYAKVNTRVNWAERETLYLFSKYLCVARISDVFSLKKFTILLGVDSQGYLLKLSFLVYNNYQ
jgi:hypothetical protein